MREARLPCQVQHAESLHKASMLPCEVIHPLEPNLCAHQHLTLHPLHRHRIQQRLDIAQPGADDKRRMLQISKSAFKNTPINIKPLYLT